MIDFLTACWFGVIGACVGSFLNVVAYRMPLGMSVIWKPSHCPKCKTQILARDNVPVLGWLWLRGKCRSCSEPISPRYAIVEAVMGLTFFVLCYAEVFSGGANLPTGPLTEGRGALENVLEPNWTVLGVYGFHCLLMCVLMSVVLVDQDGKRFPGSWIAVPTAAYLILKLGIPEISTGTRDQWVIPSVIAALGLSLLGIVFATTNIDMTLRKNLSFALFAVIGFMGFRAIPSLLILSAASAFFIALPPIRSFFGRRAWIAGVFVGTLLHIVFWKQLENALMFAS